MGTAEAVEELLTVADASRILEIGPDMVREYADSRRLRMAAITPGGIRLFLREDVERFKRERSKARR